MPKLNGELRTGEIPFILPIDDDIPASDVPDIVETLINIAMLLAKRDGIRLRNPVMVPGSVRVTGDGKLGLDLAVKVYVPNKSQAEIKAEWRKANAGTVAASRNTARKTRRTDRRENGWNFLAIDGEGQTGSCRECSCGTFTSAGMHATETWREVCSCGHFKNATQGDPATGHAHDYVMLGAGSDQITNPAGLKWDEIFEFLYSKYREGTVYAGFFLAYDFTHWLKGIPAAKASKLFTQAGIKSRGYKNQNGFTVYNPVNVVSDRTCGQVAATVPAVRSAIRRGDLDADTPMVWQLHMHADRRLDIRPKVCCKEYGDSHAPNSVREVIPPPALATGKNRCDVYRNDGKSKGHRCKWVSKHTGYPHWFDGDREPDVVYKPCSVAPVMYINDTGPFFQTALISVIEPGEWHVKTCAACHALGKDAACPEHAICTPDEYATVIKGKSDRAAATLGEEMAAYNRLENEILQRILRRLDTGLRDLGIVLKRENWYGPGQSAASWLRETIGKQYKIKTIEALGPDMLSAAQASYYGGWFEIVAHGVIPGITREYDINSAYPKIISELPCLTHRMWDHRNYAKPGSRLPALKPGQLRLVRLAAWGSDPYLGPLPHRTPTHSIIRPSGTQGWYWQHEIEASMRAGLIDRVAVFETWTYVKGCDCPPPLREIADLYQKRLDVDKKTPLGKAIKLLINSVYGKFAQSIGEPPYSNPVYASLITAGCRTMILDAIATHPQGTSAVVMMATDGVYFTSEHPTLPCTPALGDWEAGEKPDLTLLKPGVYWDRNVLETAIAGQETKFKARGVNARELGKRIPELHQAFQSWKKMPVREKDWPAVEFPLNFSMRTAKQAINHKADKPIPVGRWSTAGLVSDILVRHSAWPGTKRNIKAGSYRDGIWRSGVHPFEYGEDENGNPTIYPKMTLPYDKDFGVRGDIDAGRRDENDWGVSPDGDVSSIAGHWFEGQ